MQARLLPRGHDLPGNIEECLHILGDIIQKYNDADEENLPQENDYLKAMDLLKRINDLKGVRPVATGWQNQAQNQQIQVLTRVVIQWRERETLALAPSRAGLSSIRQIENKSNYVTCSICSHLVKDHYSLVRHQKRTSCKTVGVMKKVQDGKCWRLVCLLNANRKSFEDIQIRDAFLVALSFLFLRAQPVIRRLKADGSIPSYNKKAFPQRLIPKMLWNSLWDPGSYFFDRECLYPKDKTRMLMYDPSMFTGKVYPRVHMERQSLTQWPYSNISTIRPCIMTTYQLQNYKEGHGYWTQLMTIDVDDETTFNPQAE